MKPRILFFNGTLGAGGAERVMAMLANRFYSLGESVEIILYHNDPPFYPVNSNIRITYVSKENPGKGYLYNMLFLRRYIAKNADLVISFNASMNIYVLLSMIGLKKKIVVADRNDPRKIPKKRYMRLVRNLLYLFADGIVIQNNRNLEYFGRTIKAKSVIIPNPVEMGDYTGKALKAVKMPWIVTVGRTTPQKNQRILIDAFYRIKQKYNAYTLTIYGEGPLRDELSHYANKLGIGDSVEFPGAVQDVHDKILHAEVFVLSSNYEGMPNALIEAMVLGLPVISTRVSGATDLIINGENGLLVDIGSDTGIEDAILKYIENKDFRLRCAEAAVHIASQLTCDVIVDQWLKFLYSVHGKNNNDN